MTDFQVRDIPCKKQSNLHVPPPLLLGNDISYIPSLTASPYNVIGKKNEDIDNSRRSSAKVF